MNKRVLIGLFMLVALGISAFAQTAKTAEFEVKGNCGMCEARIEKAANSVEGVSSADWDRETKRIRISFDPGKTGIHKIHMAIAMAGHDTEMHRAPQEAYDKLPACCKYDRKKEDGPGHQGTHSGHE